MKNRRLKKHIFLALIVFVAFVVGVSLFLIRKPKQAQTIHSTEQVQESQSEKAPYEFDEEKLMSYRKQLEESQAINPDVKGILAFQSGLIVQPILHGTDNDFYLYADWKTKQHLDYGSILMDMENDITRNDMNTIIYGHYVYESYSKDRTLAFTPLAKLIEEKNYEENKYVAVITNQEVRYYEIARIYDSPIVEENGIQVTQDDLQFNLITYDEQYFNHYMNSIEKHEYFDTPVDLTYGDKLLTLQTCIEYSPNSREIVICKLIDTIKL